MKATLVIEFLAIVCGFEARKIEPNALKYSKDVLRALGAAHMDVSDRRTLWAWELFIFTPFLCMYCFYITQKCAGIMHILLYRTNRMVAKSWLVIQKQSFFIADRGNKFLSLLFTGQACQAIIEDDGAY